MNYLIVTPDGVGSTFLQRAMTLLLILDGRDVVNTHEITNGLIVEKGKILRPSKTNYEQTAHEITNILKNHSSPYMVSRLAKYHLDNRNDQEFSVKLLDFIREYYDNIVLCKRKNVFEYALSWGLRQNSGHLNVFSLKQKKEVRKKSNIDIVFFKKKLMDYKNYIAWADDLFPKAKSIYYEDLVDNPEKIINDLNIHTHSFEKHFGFTLRNYIHLEYDLHEQHINKTKHIDNMINDIRKIAKVKSYLHNLVKNKIMPAGTMPIKNMSLALKKQIVLNYNQCAKSYQEFCRNNNWADQTIMEFDFWGGKFI